MFYDYCALAKLWKSNIINSQVSEQIGAMCFLPPRIEPEPNDNQDVLVCRVPEGIRPVMKKHRIEVLCM